MSETNTRWPHHIYYNETRDEKSVVRTDFWDRKVIESGGEIVWRKDRGRFISLICETERQV